MLCLKPSEIFFSQDSISNRFGRSTDHSGNLIGETLDQLLTGLTKVSNIPHIRVAKRNEKYFTADNRRLWVFQKAEEIGILKKIEVREGGSSIFRRKRGSKFTTLNGGTSVILQDPGGIQWKDLIKKRDTNKTVDGLKTSSLWVQGPPIRKPGSKLQEKYCSSNIDYSDLKKHSYHTWRRKLVTNENYYSDLETDTSYSNEADNADLNLFYAVYTSSARDNRQPTVNNVVNIPKPSRVCRDGSIVGSNQSKISASKHKSVSSETGSEVVRTQRNNQQQYKFDIASNKENKMARSLSKPTEMVSSKLKHDEESYKYDRLVKQATTAYMVKEDCCESLDSLDVNINGVSYNRSTGSRQYKYFEKCRSWLYTGKI